MPDEQVQNLVTKFSSDPAEMLKAIDRIDAAYKRLMKAFEKSRSKTKGVAEDMGESFKRAIKNLSSKGNFKAFNDEMKQLSKSASDMFAKVGKMKGPAQFKNKAVILESTALLKAQGAVVAENFSKSEAATQKLVQAEKLRHLKRLREIEKIAQAEKKVRDIYKSTLNPARKLTAEQIQTEKMIKKVGDAVFRTVALLKNANLESRKLASSISMVKLTTMLSKPGKEASVSGGLLKFYNREAAKAVGVTDEVVESMRKVGLVGGIDEKPMTLFAKATKSAETVLTRFGKSLASLASYGASAVFLYSIIGAINTAKTAVVEYDQALKNLQAITDSTNAELSLMGDKIREVAFSTRFSASEVAKGAVLLGQAGLNAAEIYDALNAVSTLATATMTDLATVADLVTTTLRAFNLTSRDSIKIADIFAAAVNKSKLTIDKIRTAFNFVGPSAAQAGLSLETTMSIMMGLANAGLRASTIGTGLRQVLSKLVAPSQRLRDTFRNMGADIKVLDNMSDFSSVLKELAIVTNDSSRAFRVFGLRGAQAAIILGNLGEKYNEYMDNVLRANLAQKMADKQMEGLQNRLKQLNDRFGVFAVNFSEGGIKKAFGAFVDALREIVDLMNKIVSNRVINFFVGFVVILTTVTATLWLLSGAISLVSVALWQKLIPGLLLLTGLTDTYAVANGLLAKSFVLVQAAAMRLWAIIVANPWTFAIGAVIGLVAALAALHKNLTKLIEENEKFLQLTKTTVTDLEGVREKFSTLKKGSVEYRAELSRLINKHSVLADSIDLLNARFLDNGKALDELIELKRIELIKAHITAINLQEQALVKLNRQLKTSVEMREEFSGKSDKNKKRIAELRTEIKNTEMLIRLNISAAATEKGFTKDVRGEELKRISKEIADEAGIAYFKILGYLNNLGNKLRESAKAAKKEQKEYWDSVKGLFTDSFDDLDAASRASIRKREDELYRSLDREEQALKEIGASEEERTASAIKLTMEKAFAFRKDALETVRTEEEKSQQIAQIQTALFENRETLFQKDVAREEKRLAIELALNDKHFSEIEIDTVMHRMTVDAILSKSHETIMKFQRDYETALFAIRKIIKEDAKAKIDPKRNIAKELANLEKDYTSRVASLEVDRTKKIKMEHIRRLADIDAFYEKYKEVALKAGKSLVEMEERFNRLRGMEDKRYQAEVFENQKDREALILGSKATEGLIGFAEERVALENQRKIVTAAFQHQNDAVIQSLQELEIEVAEHDINIAAERIAQQKNVLEKITEFHEIGTTEYIKEEEKLLSLEKSLLDKRLNLQKQEQTKERVTLGQRVSNWQRAIEDITEAWRLGLVTDTEFFVVMKEGFDLGIVKLREFKEAEVMLFGEIKDQFLFGHQDFLGKIQRWSELVINIGKTIGEQFSEGFTKAFSSFIDGSKSAMAAFNDFARSMAKWLIELIVKQQILNLLQMIGGMGGISGQTTQGSILDAFHEGGVVGKSPLSVKVMNPNVFKDAPRFHQGGRLGRDEVPIIAKKGETIRTEEQEASLGGGGMPLTIINTIDSSMLAQALGTTEGKNAILNIISDEAHVVRGIIQR